ncbi:MAG: hypothetical protein ACI4AD_13660 [Roseburia sp.]
MLFDYLIETYGENEPIFVSEIRCDNMSEGSIRQQIMKLAESGRLKRYDTGIYFIPKKSIFKSGTQLSMNRVIEKKYLKDNEKRCGYISGVAFANQIGLTTQVAMACEVVTNKATKDYRETTLAKSRVIIRKPRVKVDEENYKVLQFLDLMKDIDYYAEVTGDELQRRLIAYMKGCAIMFSDLEPYLQYYPDKIYKNLYETRLLYGIPS